MFPMRCDPKCVSQTGHYKIITHAKITADLVTASGLFDGYLAEFGLSWATGPMEKAVV